MTRGTVLKCHGIRKAEKHQPEGLNYLSLETTCKSSFLQSIQIPAQPF